MEGFPNSVHAPERYSSVFVCLSAFDFMNGQELWPDEVVSPYHFFKFRSSFQVNAEKLQLQTSASQMHPYLLRTLVYVTQQSS